MSLSPRQDALAGDTSNAVLYAARSFVSEGAFESLDALDGWDLVVVQVGMYVVAWYLEPGCWA